MLHSTFQTGDIHVADLTVISVIQLVDLGGGLFEAELRCSDPTGQISHMTVRFRWSVGMPKINIQHVMIDGDEMHGVAFAARYVDRLCTALSTPISRFQAQGDRRD